MYVKTNEDAIRYLKVGLKSIGLNVENLCIEKTEHPTHDDSNLISVDCAGYWIWEDVNAQPEDRFCLDLEIYFPGNRDYPPDSDYTTVSRHKSLYLAIKALCQHWAISVIDAAFESQGSYEDYLEDQKQRKEIEKLQAEGKWPIVESDPDLSQFKNEDPHRAWLDPDLNDW